MPGEQELLRIQDKELERRKQNALYQDDWLIAVADDFAEEHVNGIFQIVDQARDDITDSDSKRYGRAFYEFSAPSEGSVVRASRL
jgi:hypothetical protein